MGLRERKREQTRHALADAALALFAERGYDATTIADIAERAGVSPRTFFTHHPSKEHVLFCEDDEWLQALREHLAARRPGEDTLSALRQWLRTLLAEWDVAERTVAEQTRRQVIDTTPVLLAHERQLLSRFEVVLREAVAADLGESTDDLRPRLVAATAAAALETTRPAPGVIHSPEEILDRLDQALTFLRGGLDALQPDGEARREPRFSAARGGRQDAETAG
jgi:AcrR family transcriptional regulator